MKFSKARIPGDSTLNVERIKEDMRFLAGRLLHRSAQTEEERKAAEFIRDRLAETTPDVEIDEFASIDNFPYLFASYYSEFLVVAILAVWWPVVASFYGLGAFLAYMAEFLGYRVFSRFFPHYDSQNVVARRLAGRPRHLFIVHAHYDSGCAGPLSRPGLLPWLRRLHLGVVAAMVVVVATSVADMQGTLVGAEYPVAAALRWGAVAYLLGIAMLMYYVSTQGEDSRGANGNASGVAALLRVAEAFAERPLEEADLWFVASGSNEAWMRGMQDFLHRHRPEKESTYLLNIEGVGAGALRYLEREGMLLSMEAAPELAAAASACAKEYGAAPATMRAVPTAAHIPLSFGYRAMTLMGLDEHGLPPNWNQISDRVTAIDEAEIGRAADFAEAILRGVERTLSNKTPPAR